jgi:hypothetical protein
MTMEGARPRARWKRASQGGFFNFLQGSWLGTENERIAGTRSLQLT